MAEREWERTDPDDPDYRVAAAAVVCAWLTYHEAALEQAGHFILIVDDEHRYVAVSRNVTDVLGFAPEELIGQHIEDVVAAGSQVDTPSDWQRFLRDGHQEGEYSVCDRDGRDVRLRYQARAHHPIPGYHLSRLWVGD